MSSPTQATTTQPDVPDRARYYTAALRALRFVERRAPTTRRFGSEADAQWGAFRGNLTTADRLDLLLRDADAHWPAAFGARNVFALRAAAEDEAFGAGWSPLDPLDAEELWRKVLAEAPPEGVRETVLAAASSWDLEFDPPELGTIAPTDKLLVVGPSAVAAVVTAFAADKDLGWADQVVCVATPPAHRQLAALGAALLNDTKNPTALASPAGKTTISAGRRLVLSSDAAPEDATWARAAAAP
ncbi:hypothetical protein WMF28_15335 [Sorangium sp. So ce590]|uniref:hypothetical protein n=1 Tax=Sorangium sp. So ce590 TaxID=3133317 RepID=UPI003F603E07